MATRPRSRAGTSAARGVPTPDPRVIWQARDLLSRADVLLAEAVVSESAVERFRLLYLAGLRAAGAALAARENVTSRRTSNSAWARLPRAVPALTPTATYFAGLSRLRSDLEAGLDRRLSAPEVADVEAHVRGFLDEVDEILTDYERGPLPAQLARSA